MASTVVRNRLGVLLHRFRKFWTRPDERDVALEHVPGLRQLVNARLAQELPHLRNLVLRPLTRALPLAVVVVVHRPKLHQAHGPAALPDAILEAEERPAVLQLERHPGERDERQ